MMIYGLPRQFSSCRVRLLSKLPTTGFPCPERRSDTMRILLVEDDPVLADGISLSLRQCGYNVDLMTNGIDADQALTYQTYDVVLLDLGLPKLGGLQVLSRLRARKSTVPVLILTARDSLNDRVGGLDLGADDYLIKPFDIAEVEARLRALLRRGNSITNRVINYGPLTFDTVDRQVVVNNQALDLSARELSALEMLLLRVGRVVSKEKMVEHLYGWNEVVGDNAVEVCVHRMRRKLEPFGINIRTVRGLGYMLDKPNG